MRSTTLTTGACVCAQYVSLIFMVVIFMTAKSTMKITKISIPRKLPTVRYLSGNCPVTECYHKPCMHVHDGVSALTYYKNAVYRCNFLGREVSLLMQLLEDADIPDPCASKVYILAYSQLAELLWLQVSSTGYLLEHSSLAKSLAEVLERSVRWSIVYLGACMLINYPLHHLVWSTGS